MTLPRKGKGIGRKGVMIRKGILKSFNSGTYKATVQIVGSLSVWLDNVVVSEALAAADMVIGRSVAVLVLDPSNPDDSVVIGLWGATASGQVTNLDGGLSNATFGGVGGSPLDGGDST